MVKDVKKEQSNKEFHCCEGFVAYQNDKGVWLYKATDTQLLKQDKKTLKKKYHDLPRFKVIPQYEEQFKKQFNSYVAEIAKDLTRKLKQLIK